MSTPTLPTPGSTILHYTVQKTLGSGGEASVFLARDNNLQRLVALKIIQIPEANAHAADAGLSEARLIARLNHRHILQVYHGDILPKYCVIAMEYMAKGSLAELLQPPQTLSLSTALRFTQHLADALHHAHHLGIVHRDIKPHNLLISDRNTIKIADFGLAFQYHLAPPPPSLVGTPSFMAPEVWSGAPPNPRSDIYSLGACLFFMLTGQPPFVRADIDQLRSAHLQEAPQIPAGTPRFVSQLILACMDKRPQQRPTAINLKRDLQFILASPPAPLLKPAGDKKLDLNALPSAPSLSRVAALATLERELLALDALKGARAALYALASSPPGSARALVLSSQHPSIAAQLADAVMHAQRVQTGEPLLFRSVDQALDALKAAPAQPTSAACARLVHLSGAIDDDAMQALLTQSLTRDETSRWVFIIAPPPQALTLPADALSAATPPLSADDIQQLAQRTVHAAYGKPLLWSRDGLRLLSRLALEAGFALDLLLHNALMLTLNAARPAITTWALLGATQHPHLIQQPSDILAQWRAYPARWPAADSAQTPTEGLLASLQMLGATHPAPDTAR